MAVPCGRCGRQYDVTLFQFGRTIDCTCGARVGVEPRVRLRDREGPPRFSADSMLGRLARWLRATGCDTLYDAHIPDAELVRTALAQNRVILTRDRALPEEWRVENIVLIESEEPLAQLREVAARFSIDWRAGAFTRCTRCNAPIEPIAAQELHDRVPPRVLRERAEFRSCPTCARVYWDGSHTERMRRKLEETLG